VMERPLTEHKHSARSLHRSAHRLLTARGASDKLHSGPKTWAIQTWTEEDKQDKVSFTFIISCQQNELGSEFVKRISWTEKRLFSLFGRVGLFISTHAFDDYKHLALVCSLECDVCCNGCLMQSKLWFLPLYFIKLFYPSSALPH